MIETRRLLPEEFKLLNQFPDRAVFNPEHSVVVVIGEGEKLVGRTSILGVPHVEGTYIDPAHRNGSTLKRLMTAIEQEARKEGIKQLLSYAPDFEVEMYLYRIGYKKMPISVWEKEL